ncbi:MAG: DUF1631 family protein [Pseudomonadota bacterium]
MSVQSGTTTLEATLELPDTAVLGGPVVLAGEDALTIGPVRLVQRPGSGNKIRIPAGARCLLRSDALADVAEVVVTGVEGRDVALSFRDGQCQAARSWLRSLGSADAEPAGTPPASAAGTDIAGFEHLSLNQLDMMIQKFLLELTTHLFDRSTSSRQVASGHDVFYEALNAVKDGGTAIAEDFLSKIREHFSDLTAGSQLNSAATSIPDSVDSLNLVDLRDFEDHLAIARMVKVGEDLHQVALESLIFRTAELIDARPTDIRLPIHVAQLCSAFRQAIENKKIPAEALPAIFEFFVSQFIRRLDEYYAPLNSALASQGIRPGIEDEIRARGSLLNASPGGRPEPRPKEAPLAPEPHTPDTAPSGEHPDLGASQDRVVPAGEDTLLSQAARLSAPQTGSSTAAAARAASSGASGVGGVSGKSGDSKHAPAASQAAQPASADAGEQRYQSVVNALGRLRESEGQAVAAEGAPAAKHSASEAPLAPAGLASALDSLQSNAGAREAVSQSGSLREYLANHGAELGALEEGAELAPESLNQLDLVDNLFGTMQAGSDISSRVQPSLDDLQIPLAKLALLEPRFFADRQHPAREVVDKLASVAGSANFPNPALESRIGDIVSDIVENYERDSAVFSQALERVDRLVQQQARAAERNRERVVSAEEGQERLEQARQRVDQALDDRLASRDVPRPLIDLVDSGLRETLVLTQLREGPDSAAWQEQLNTLDRIVQSLGAVNLEPAQQESQAAQLEPLLDALGQQIASAVPTGPDPGPALEELRQVIGGEAKAELTRTSPSEDLGRQDPSAQRRRIDELPRLRRWIRRVEELTQGTWLSYRDAQGRPKRMQLARTNTARNRFIFVNERGQKQADLSAVQLARQLSRGVREPNATDDMSLVDQSMYSTLESVQQSLSFSRNRDSLTRLINHDTLLDQMRRALRHSQKRSSEHGALYLDVDQFQLVNQVYGREAGDQLLAEFGKLLAQIHSSKSSSARIEGDAFGILLLDRPMSDSIRFAQRIREDIANSDIDINGDRVSFTVSIGAAPLLQHSQSVENVLDNARTAMKVAKDKGRNRVIEYSEEQSEIDRQVASRKQSREELEMALADERFSLRAQPIMRNRVDGSEADAAYYELLLSVNDKDGEQLGLKAFIESAETYGFMTLIDRWVVREAFQWINQLMDDQKEVPRLAINLSGSSVIDDAFLDYLLEQISEFGVGTSQLCFEITEAGTITNLVKAADFIRTFRNIGCKFSIDDFGTGLSSHNLLRELPVDFVKIDGSFISKLPHSRTDLAMVQSINDMAHFLGQKTIAECVENDEALAMLRDLGVDYLQGWALSRPKPLADVAEQLSGLHG